MTAFNDFLMNFVVNAFWQVALVTAVASSGSWMLLRRVSARRRYFVWVMALFLSVALPLWSALPLERKPLKTSIFPTPATVLNVGELSKPGSIPGQPQRPDKISLWRQIPFGQIFVGVYLLFLLYRIRVLWCAWRLTLAIRQGAFPAGASETLQSVLAHCRTTLGVGVVALLRSPSVAVPVTMGLRRPVIILPERLLSETATDLLSAALGHELAHVKRGDYAWNLIYELLFLPISFHPAAALVKRRISETRELACDEVVSEQLLDAHVY
ncbi:MAG: M56 family metallopeptidase, partial [Blastocatellia bacterium]|nr:M56 family metallopeptidase [Blastocatellia bacterium]